MKCLECGRDYKKVTNTHLKRCCGLTEAEYLAKNAGAKLMDPELKLRYGSPGDANPNWKGGISKPHCKQCGKKISEHSHVTHCRRCRSLLNNPFQGKHHNAETRARMVESAKSRPKDTYKYGVTEPEELSRRRKAAWERIPHAERAASIQAFIEAGQKHNKKNCGTRIEVTVAEMVSKLHCSFAQNVQIGVKNVDFLINESIIVECYGDYWHCNPKIYEKGYYHANLHMTASEKWLKDTHRNEWLKSQGMTVIVFWEADIKAHSEAVFSQIAELVGTQKD